MSTHITLGVWEFENLTNHTHSVYTCAQMDENTENQTQTETQTPMPEERPSSQPVSFPSLSSQDNGSKKGKIILILSVLAILGVLGFFILKGVISSPSGSPTPSPLIEGISTPEGIVTPTPETIDKSQIKIEVQNGTGIPGEAAFLQGQLKSLGYTNITVGNASSQDNTTTIVTFATNAPQAVVSEITAKLEELYKKVETKTSSTLKTNVLIVTGLRKGATPRPSGTPSPTPTSTPTPTPSAT